MHPVLRITTILQVDAALFCQHDFLLTQKQTRWLISNVIHNFCSLLIKKAAIFDCKLWVVEVLATFRPKILTSTNIFRP